MISSENSVPPVDVPAIGDMYDHATGVYTVDWVCCETCIGLCGDAMTWTGSVHDLPEAGFSRHNTGGKRTVSYNKQEV